MIKDILVHVDRTRSAKKRLVCAFDLAQRHDARLTGLHVTPSADVAPYYRPSIVNGIVKDIEKRFARDAIASEKQFRTVAAKRSTQSEWESREGSMSRQICNLAQAADLVIVGQYESEGSAEHHPLILAEEVVINSGRPVLVVPAAAEHVLISRVLIAWDGSREAVRAVHDALPLLCKTRATAEIAAIDEARERIADMEHLLDHLKRHDIQVEPEIHLHAKGARAGALVDRLKQGHFDLLVMGAYGHPVWIEFLFGGTTTSALLNASTPVLVSH